MKRAPLTCDEKDQIARLREAGLTYKQIGTKLGMHPNLVSWQCLLLGADPPQPRPLAPVPVSSVTIKRGNHTVTRFTVAVDELLMKLEGEGLSYAAIARKLGRRRNSIAGRLATLARREERATMKGGDA